MKPYLQERKKLRNLPIHAKIIIRRLLEVEENVEEGEPSAKKNIKDAAFYVVAQKIIIQRSRVRNVHIHVQKTHGEDLRM